MSKVGLANILSSFTAMTAPLTQGMETMITTIILIITIMTPNITKLRKRNVSFQVFVICKKVEMDELSDDATNVKDFMTENDLVYI